MKKLVLALMPIMMVGCGGGGDASSSASKHSFPVETAFENAYHKPQNWTLNSKEGYSVTIKREPSTSFGVNAAETTVIFSGKGYSGGEVHTIYSTKNPFRYLKERLDSVISSGAYAPVASNGTKSVKSQTLPKKAKVGDAGGIYTATKTVSQKEVSSIVANWQLSADTANTAWLCAFKTVTKLEDNQKNTGSECYKINTNGDILAMKYQRDFSIDGKVTNITFN